MSVSSCTESYSVDGEKPTITALYTTTTNSIHFQINANDNYSGIKEYIYMLDGGEIKTSTSNIISIENLNPGTNYTIHVFAKDNAGNISEEFTIITTTVKPNDVSAILAKYTKDDSRSGQITAPFTGNTPTTVYSKADDSETSYVFAGVNPNNWVKLGNIYFRIIRFNGDGSLRLIYSGESSAETSGTGTGIEKKCLMKILIIMNM